MKKILGLVLFVGCLYAQSNPILTGPIVDISHAGHVINAKVYSSLGSLPTIGCIPNEEAIVQGVPLNAQIYINSGLGSCVWTAQGGGGGGGLPYPGSPGIVYGLSPTSSRVATSTDVTTLFTGCSPSTPALGYLGDCVSGGSTPLPGSAYVVNASSSPQIISAVTHGNGINPGVLCFSGTVTSGATTGHGVLCDFSKDSSGNVTVTWGDAAVGSIMVYAQVGQAGAPGPTGPAGPSGASPLPYVTNSTTSPQTITASTHGQGLNPIVLCFSGAISGGATTGNYVPCAFQKSGTSGDVIVAYTSGDVGSIWVGSAGGSGGGGGGAVSSVFGRTGAVGAQTGDYTAAQVTNAVDSTSSYADPSWITSLSATKLTGTVLTGNLPATIVYNNQVNTGTAAMTLNLAASTVSNAFRAPVVAGATSTANGGISYDSTANMLHAAQSGADAYIPQSTATPTNGDCALWVVSGGNYKLGNGVCPGAGGGSAFNTITTGTNTTASMVVGSGATLSATGTGSISATSVTGFTAGTGVLTGPSGSNLTLTATAGVMSNNTSGNAGTATATQTTPTVCSPGFTARGVDSSWNSVGCTAVGSGSIIAVTGTSPIVSSGGSSPAISCPTCATGSSFTSGQLVVGGGSQALSLGNISGDATTSGTTVLTFNTVNPAVGVCGDPTDFPNITLNAKGLATNCTTNPLVSSFNSRSGAVSLLASDVNGVGAITNNTSGTASNVTGTVAVSNGGTGKTSLGTSLLKGNGTFPISNAVSTDVTTLFIGCGAGTDYLGFDGSCHPAISGVSSFNTRTGAITLTASDVNSVGQITNSIATAGTIETSLTTPVDVWTSPTTLPFNIGTSAACSPVAGSGWRAMSATSLCVSSVSTHVVGEFLTLRSNGPSSGVQEALIVQPIFTNASNANFIGGIQSSLQFTDNLTVAPNSSIYAECLTKGSVCAAYSAEMHVDQGAAGTAGLNPFTSYGSLQVAGIDQIPGTLDFAAYTSHANVSSGAAINPTTLTDITTNGTTTVTSAGCGFNSSWVNSSLILTPDIGNHTLYRITAVAGGGCTATVTPTPSNTGGSQITGYIGINSGASYYARNGQGMTLAGINIQENGGGYEYMGVFNTSCQSSAGAWPCSVPRDQIWQFVNQPVDGNTNQGYGVSFEFYRNVGGGNAGSQLANSFRQDTGQGVYKVGQMRVDRCSGGGFTGAGCIEFSTMQSGVPTFVGGFHGNTFLIDAGQFLNMVPTTVSTIPPAGSTNKGQCAMISDAALTPTYYGVYVTGIPGLTALICSDGTNWRYM